MEVRCPQCHAPIDLSDDTPLSDITCPSCGSGFSLLGEETLAYQAGGVKTIGHFELVEQIGVGSFGSVWRARDSELDRTVAVKIPRKGQLDAAETEQFLREARAAAQLSHPNIVGVHEVGREEDTVYIVSDFVEGLTLADWLTGQQPTCREAAQLCAKIADALHHAHEAGVIHRDLKPGNIILDVGGEPHVMDFGLARREAGEVTMTVEGKVLGTPAYMSPEQAKGEAHRADRRSDVYSLGVILFELLTGEKPFRGNVRMLLHQVINEEAPSPRRLNASVPRDVETICVKCLEKDPPKRYCSARELAEELRRFLEGEPIQARPITTPGRFWRWCKRNPVVSSLAAGLVVALVGGMAGVTWQWVRAEGNAATARGQAERANVNAAKEAKARQAAEEARQETRRHLYVSDMNVAQQAWDAANVERVLDLLNRHRPQPGQEDLRGFEWYYLWRLCQRGLMTPTLKQSERVGCVAFSPDGETLASGGDDQTVKLWHVATGELRQTLKGSKPGSVVFSPDGATLASGSWRGPVKLWNVDTGELLHNLTVDSQVFSVVFSADGTTLASGNWDGTAKLWNVATGELLHNLQGHTESVLSVAFSPDGATLAGSSGGAVILWDVITGQPEGSLQQRADSCVTFCPDGQTLAAGGGDGTVKLWEVATGEELHTFRGHEGRVRFITFSRDGQTLASAGQDNTVKLWDLATRDLKQTLVGHAGAVNCVALSPDGKTLASASDDATVKLWDVAAEKEPNILKGHTWRVTSVTFSRDGILASGSWDKTVKVWNLATGEPEATFDAHTDRVEEVAFSRDGILASAGRDNMVRLWDVAAGRLEATLEGHAREVHGLAFSPDGKTLASGSGGRGTVKFWDVVTREELPTFLRHVGAVRSLAFSPDGQRLASTSWLHITVTDLATGEEQDRLRGHRERVLSVAFSPDGQTLASSSEDATVKLWHGVTGEFKGTLKGHGGHVCSVAFSPGGKTLASASLDRTVKLWDVATGEQRGTLAGHTEGVFCVAFSADGKTLASGSIGGGTIRLWRAATEEAVLEATALLTLENRARAIATADATEQRQILADVKSHLAAKLGEGLARKDVFLATSTARVLEESGNYKLASQAYRSFAEVVAKSKDEKYSNAARTWEENARRLDLLAE